MHGLSFFRSSSPNLSIQSGLYPLDVTSGQLGVKWLFCAFYQLSFHSVRPTLLILGTTNGWLASRTVQRPSWAKTQVISANSRTQWVSFSCLLLIFMFSIRGVHGSVDEYWPAYYKDALRSSTFCLNWSSFCGVYEIGFKGQGFLTKSYTKSLIQSLKVFYIETNIVLLQCVVCNPLILSSCLAFTERTCIWWGLSACKLQYFCLPEPSEAGDLQCKFIRKYLRSPSACGPWW